MLRYNRSQIWRHDKCGSVGSPESCGSHGNVLDRFANQDQGHAITVAALRWTDCWTPQGRGYSCTGSCTLVSWSKRLLEVMYIVMCIRPGSEIANSVACEYDTAKVADTGSNPVATKRVFVLPAYRKTRSGLVTATQVSVPAINKYKCIKPLTRMNHVVSHLATGVASRFSSARARLVLSLSSAPRVEKATQIIHLTCASPKSSSQLVAARKPLFNNQPIHNFVKYAALQNGRKSAPFTRLLWLRLNGRCLMI